MVVGVVTSITDHRAFTTHTSKDCTGEFGTTKRSLMTSSSELKQIVSLQMVSPPSDRDTTSRRDDTIGLWVLWILIFKVAR
jgi:hypothetical protein